MARQNVLLGKLRSAALPRLKPHSPELFRRPRCVAVILRFQDAAGNIVSYPLSDFNTVRSCWWFGLRSARPGTQPDTDAMFTLMPAGNDTTLGDGLNTTGFRGNVSTPLTFDTVAARSTITSRASCGSWPGIPINAICTTSQPAGYSRYFERGTTSRTKFKGSQCHQRSRLSDFSKLV